MKDPHDFFPGDPPLGEVGCYIGLLFAVIAGLLWLALRSLRHVHSAQRMAGGARRAMLLALMVMVAFGNSIALRNVGGWGRLKAELRRRQAELVACGPSCRWPPHGAPSGGPPWEFQFSDEYRPVRLTVRDLGDEPAVVVDFGHGSVARFDLDTMIVLDSD